MHEATRVVLRTVAMLRITLVCVLSAALLVPGGCNDRDDEPEYQRVEREEEGGVSVTVEVRNDDDNHDDDDDDNDDDDDDDDGDDDDDEMDDDDDDDGVE